MEDIKTNQQKFYKRTTKHLKLNTLKSSSIDLQTPLVTWGVITTFNGHNWPNRVVEFLTEDPNNVLSDYTEMVVLFTQDKGVLKKAEEIVFHIVESQQHLYPKLNLKEKAKRIKLIEDYQDGGFYLGWARLRLLQEAKGDFILFRDADTRVVGYNLSLISLKHAVKNHLGLLGYPSLNNYEPFKPRPTEPVIRDKRYPDLLIAHGIHGMATFSPTIIERKLHRNPAIVGWGEHPSFCTKISRAGYLMAYIDPKGGYILSTSDGEASTENLSKATIAGKPNYEREIGATLLAHYYRLPEKSTFIKRLRSQYGIDLNKVSELSRKQIEIRQPTFHSFQKPDNELRELYPFEPTGALEHGNLTNEYIQESYNIAKDIYEPIEEKIIKLKLDKSIFKKA